MTLDTNKQTVETEVCIGSGVSQALARAETLVPGAGREAIEVLLADALCAADSVESQTDRLVFEGTVRCQAAYRQGSESTLRSVEAQTRISQVFDMPGAAPGMTARACCSIEHVEARYENGHMVFLVTVSISAQAFRLTQAEIITSIESGGTAETLLKEICTCRITAETAATHTLRQETTLPAALDARTSLMEWGEVWVESWESDLGGIRVKGRLNTETLISSGVEGRPAASVRNIFDFEQLAEVPEWLANDVCAEAELKKISTRVEQGGEREDSVLITEAEIAIRVTSLGKDKVTVLTDAYTTQGAQLEITAEEYGMCGDIRCLHITEGIKGTLLLNENAPGVGSVIAVAVHPNIGSISGGVIEGVMEATVLYMPGGSDIPASARSEMPFSIKLPDPVDDNCATVCMRILSAEASTLMSDRVELKCAAGISIFLRDETTQTLVTDISAGADIRKRHGIVLVWPYDDDSAWSVAKRYRTPLSDIKKLNGGSDILESGKALMIKI